MSFDEYLSDLRKKNPQLLPTQKVTMDVTVFEAQLKRAFEAGVSTGRKAAWDFPREIENLLGDLFGGK